MILLGKEGKKEEGEDMWSIDEGGVMIKEHEKLLCNHMRATSSPKVGHKIMLCMLVFLYL